MNFQTLVTTSQLTEAYPVIKELRPNLTLQSFKVLREQARLLNGYELIGAYENGDCVGVMGYRILVDLVHGKHLYIDDLVVTQMARSNGIGAKLLLIAEKLAKSADCNGLRLCTGIENSDGKRFYEREGWKPQALAYKKPCKSHKESEINYANQA